MRLALRDEDGQAASEYVIALVVTLVLCLALGGLYRAASLAGQRKGSFLRRGFAHAPYSLPPAGEVGVQCLKDALMH
jgi:Flp pilus assembly pilin Flp